MQVFAYSLSSLALPAIGLIVNFSDPLLQTLALEESRILNSDIEITDSIAKPYANYILLFKPYNILWRKKDFPPSLEWRKLGNNRLTYVKSISRKTQIFDLTSIYSNFNLGAPPC